MVLWENQTTMGIYSLTWPTCFFAGDIFDVLWGCLRCEIDVEGSSRFFKVEDFCQGKDATWQLVGRFMVNWSLVQYYRKMRCWQSWIPTPDSLCLIVFFKIYEKGPKNEFLSQSVVITSTMYTMYSCFKNKISTQNCRDIRWRLHLGLVLSRFKRKTPKSSSINPPHP